MRLERYRFIISDGYSFEYVGEWAYVNPLAAEADAIRMAEELAQDDTWHGGWISVTDTRGNGVTRVPIDGRALTKSEIARRNSQRAIRKSKSIIRRLDEAAARRARRPPCNDD